MTEQFPDNSTQAFKDFEAMADNLETSLIDPHMEKVLEKAALYDEYFRTFPLDPERRTKMMNELDSDWAYWMRSPITVSGKVYPLSSSNKTDESYEVTDALALSQGFRTYLSMPGEDEEDASEFRFGRIMKELHISGSHLGEGYNDNTVYVALAPLDEIYIHSDVPSPERAKAWLEVSSPYFVDEVERRIMRSKSHEDSILALKGLQVDASLDVSDDLTRNSAEVYLNSLIPMDQDVPYKFGISGITYQKDGRGKIASTNRELDAIGDAKRIRLGKAEYTDGSSKWELYFSTKLTSGDFSTQPIVCDVPIDSVAWLVSLRRSLLNLETIDQ